MPCCCLGFKALHWPAHRLSRERLHPSSSGGQGKTTFTLCSRLEGLLREATLHFFLIHDESAKVAGKSADMTISNYLADSEVSKTTSTRLGCTLDRQVRAIDSSTVQSTQIVYLQSSACPKVFLGLLMMVTRQRGQAVTVTATTNDERTSEVQWLRPGTTYILLFHWQILRSVPLAEVSCVVKVLPSGLSQDEAEKFHVLFAPQSACHKLKLRYH